MCIYAEEIRERGFSASHRKILHVIKCTETGGRKVTLWFCHLSIKQSWNMDVTFSLRAARGESCITDATQRFSTLLCLVYKEPESISTAECSTELSKDLKKKKSSHFFQLTAGMTWKIHRVKAENYKAFSDQAKFIPPACILYYLSVLAVWMSKATRG